MLGGWDLAAVLAGLAIGGAFGAVVQATHFCTMGAVSDAVLFGSYRRLRTWFLAIAIALAGTQILAAAGLVSIESSRYAMAPVVIPALILGGLMFGFGMVLAGGCVSRNLVRLGSGSLKALMVLLIVGITAMATQTGVLAGLNEALGRVALDSAALGVPTWTVGGLLSLIVPLAPSSLDPVIGLLIAAAIVRICLADPTFRRLSGELILSTVLGLLVVAGWLVTGWLLAGESVSEAPSSLTFVLPTGQLLAYIMQGGASLPQFGVAIVAGTLIGAAIWALARARFRLEFFTDGPDMLRNVVGGVLMGVGGVLALGCTIGQGISGISALSIGSFIALGAILFGAWWGLKFLETGRLIPGSG